MLQCPECVVEWVERRGGLQCPACGVCKDDALKSLARKQEWEARSARVVPVPTFHVALELAPQGAGQDHPVFATSGSVRAATPADAVSFLAGLYPTMKLVSSSVEQL